MAGKREAIMTCDEAVELIYRFAEIKPSSQAQRDFQEHIQKSPACKKFIQNLAKQSGEHFDVGCGAIPDSLLEQFSVLMKKNLENAG